MLFILIFFLYLLSHLDHEQSWGTILKHGFYRITFLINGVQWKGFVYYSNFSSILKDIFQMKDYLEE